MKHWFNRNYRTLIITAFLIPIITVAIVSISHVTKWYGVSNPLTWATYLSIGIEIAALSALAAISANMGKKVYFPFFVVTLIQFIGNIYFSYSYIDIASKSFRDWVDLVSPLLQFMGVDSNDYVGHRRFLSFFAGGMLPIISLSFLHMLVKFTEEDRLKDQKHDEIEEEFKHYKEEHSGQTTNTESQIIDSKDLMGEIAKVRLTEDDFKKLENILLKSPNEEKKDRSEILADIMKKDQELGLYNQPYDNSLIKDDDEYTQLSDNSDNVYDVVDENELPDEDLVNLVYEQSINNDEGIVEPTEEEIEENNKVLDEVKTEELVDIKQEESLPIPDEVQNDVVNDASVVDDEKKNQ